MKVGYHGINVGACALPAIGARVAKAAEDAGFESLWTAEHVVLPDPQAPPSPVPPFVPFLDPAASLAFLAAHTAKIGLATGIIILPQRNPLVLAKEMASVDVLSGGRLIFGIGAGYLTQEFEALGIPFEDRGRRTDEYIEAIRELWTSEKPAYDGRFVRFSGIDAQPRPAAKPHPPIVVGGHTRGAFRRAVRYAQGWYGFHTDLETTERHLSGIAEAAKATERPAELGPLEISVTPPAGTTADDAARYRDLGVHRLILLGMARSEDDALRVVEEAAPIVAL